MKITIDGEEIEQVTKFCYLGSPISDYAKCHKEIKKRMAKALTWSITLYGVETWTMRKEDVKRIEAFEMWIWRRIEDQLDRTQNE